MKGLFLKCVLVALAVALLSFTPVSAGALAVYGTWWSTDEGGDAAGIGAGYAWNLTEAWDIEARLAWYEELTDEPLKNLFNGATPIATGLTVIPLEVGARFNFARDSDFWNPWFGAGLAYYALDTDSGNIDDEVGFYGTFGSTFGDGKGMDFYAEVGYRFVKAQVTNLDVNNDNVLDNFDVKLNGPYASAGVSWKF